MPLSEFQHLVKCEFRSRNTRRLCDVSAVSLRIGAVTFTQQMEDDDFIITVEPDGKYGYHTGTNCFSWRSNLSSQNIPESRSEAPRLEVMATVIAESTVLPVSRTPIIQYLQPRILNIRMPFPASLPPSAVTSAPAETRSVFHKLGHQYGPSVISGASIYKNCIFPGQRTRNEPIRR